MPELSIDVYGIPEPQERPRACRAGGFIKVYSPHNQWYDRVYATALACRPSRPFDFPIRLRIEFLSPRPRRPKHPYWMVTRPDLDNLIKGTLDAMTKGRIWRDDSLVVEITATKSYAGGDDPPGAIIEIYNAEEPA